MLSSLTRALSNWPHKRWPWVLLATTATLLTLTALYFQHVLQLEPCEQCIYQRTAVIAIAIGAWAAAIAPHLFVLRLVGYISWGWAAIAGFASAHYHVWVQTGINALFASCNLEPNFPVWLPLHEWLPSVFAVTGLCSDANWQFLNMAMSEWMRLIFALYIAAAGIIIGCRLWHKRMP